MILSTIDKLMVGQANDAFSDPYFVNTILGSYINFFFTNNLYNNLILSPLDFHKYQGDFYGLLDKNNVPKKYHSFILRFNGGVDTSTFNFGNKTTILIPEYNSLEQIASAYETNNKNFI